VAGAWATTLVSFAVLLFTSKLSFGNYVLWDFNAGCAQCLPDFMLWNGQLIQPGEQPGAACTLPDNAVVPEKRNIFPNTNLEFMIPSRTSVVGFLIGWAFVAVIVVTVYMIASG